MAIPLRTWFRSNLHNVEIAICFVVLGALAGCSEEPTSPVDSLDANLLGTWTATSYVGVPVGHSDGSYTYDDEILVSGNSIKIEFGEIGSGNNCRLTVLGGNLCQSAQNCGSDLLVATEGNTLEGIAVRYSDSVWDYSIASGILTLTQTRVFQGAGESTVVIRLAKE